MKQWKPKAMLLALTVLAGGCEVLDPILAAQVEIRGVAQVKAVAVRDIRHPLTQFYECTHPINVRVRGGDAAIDVRWLSAEVRYYQGASMEPVKTERFSQDDLHYRLPQPSRYEWGGDGEWKVRHEQADFRWTLTAEYYETDSYRPRSTEFKGSCNA